MSEVLVLADARARGISLPADDTVAQAILDETEAFIARELGGPLTGSRSETFYVGTGGRQGKLSLLRYTDAATLTDNGVTVAGTQYLLVDRGSAIARKYQASSWWWTGPYVVVTYEPNDEAELTSVAYQVLSLASTPQVAAGDLLSETIGSYSYTRGSSASTPQGATASRRALVSALVPKRDALASLSLTRLDYPQASDWGNTGRINDAELPV